MFLNLLMMELNQILKLLHEVWVVLTDAFISHDILRQCCVDRCVIHVPIWQASLVTSTFSIFLPGKKWMRNEDCRNRFRLGRSSWKNAKGQNWCILFFLMHIFMTLNFEWTLRLKWTMSKNVSRSLVDKLINNLRS